MSQIVFKINGIQHVVAEKYGPDVTLNDYIRNVTDQRGTKYMCQEGGCGACIVSVRAALPPSHEMKTFSVNSCLVSVLSCHRWEITTVEGIGNRTIGYHDIQTRLAKFNGTQCGYCTPGWVMNMYSLRESKDKLTAKEIENHFASNLCRCTGYRPIVDAFKSFAIDADQDLLDKITDLEDLDILKPCGVKCKDCCRHKKVTIDDELDDEDDVWCVLDEVDHDTITTVRSGHNWYKVYSLDEAFRCMKNGDYKLIAGNTGQGVYPITGYETNVIDIFSVPELKGYIIDVNLILGAGMTLTDMKDLFLKLSIENNDFSYLKQLYEHVDLVAHVPVRNIGTIAGNLFLKYLHNEFPSDIFLILEIVGALITIVQRNGKKVTMSLSDFLKFDMKGKIIYNVILPPLSGACSVKTFKIMPRSQNAHAHVNAGFFFEFNANTEIIKRTRIVYGNINKNFIHASKTEGILIGKDLFNDVTLQLALKTLYDEIVPEKMPPEPSVEFRKMLAVTLYYKAILSLCPETKVNPKNKSGAEYMKRGTSKGTQIFDTNKTLWPLNQPIPKIEGLSQCSGEATFANDLPRQEKEVFGAFVTADAPPGSIISGFDSTDALKIPGVITIYTAQDIPGPNSFTPKGVPYVCDFVEEILCAKEVKFYGQPTAIIVADREKTATKAAKFVKIKYESISKNKPLLNVPDVLASTESSTRVKQDVDTKPKESGNDIDRVIDGEFLIGGQYHFTMETQTCIVNPTEDGMDVYSSSQWPDLINVAVAKCLNIMVNKVNVIIRRVGGAYGCKISRSTQIACAAAIVSHLQGKPCRFIMPLRTNMKVIGKRMPAYSKFKVGVNNKGEIQHMKNVLYTDLGCSLNEKLTPLILKHLDNCYDSKRWHKVGYTVLTDTASNTSCRAPGSTEGIAMIEYIMEKIAFELKIDPLDVRKINMLKDDNNIEDVIEQLKKDSNFDNRRKEIETFNQHNRWRKRMLKLMPLKYGIFVQGPYNSLVSIYHGDGSVAITHGGVEMGQGINTKVAQVCAYTLGIPLDKVSIKPTRSISSPNSMVTGGSVGSECVALATMKACEVLLERLKDVKKDMDNDASWEEVAQKAFDKGVELQAIYSFRDKGEIKSYDVYAACALEVEVDILTGMHDIRRVDIVEDTGRSLSPEIDVGQIEGAFMMGLGYWTSEKLIYDESNGNLLTDRTWTYKPPGIKDIPADMRIYFRRNGRNEAGVLQSKATGEPAVCLSTIIFHAIREAVRSARLEAGYEDYWFDFENPCTVENVFLAVGHKLDHFKLQ